MFEKEAEEYAEKGGLPREKYLYGLKAMSFKDGAEFGYNLAKEEMDYLNQHWKSEEERKTNEWHDLEKDPTDLPKEEKQYVVKAKDLDGDITVWICWYWTETKTFTGSYLSEMNVIKWKEIE